MTVKELYGLIGGDYSDALQRFMSDDVILKFLKMFLNDENMTKLSVSLEENDPDGAFCAVHTLKGIALNLSFSKFADISSEMTEHLRGKSTLPDDTGRFYENLNHEYQKIITAIKGL